MESLLLSVVCLIASQVGSAADESKPIAVLSGANSKVSKQSYERITTDTAMQEAWARHLGTSPGDAYRPQFEIDFSRCLVVAVFVGDRINTRGVRIDSVRQRGNALVVRFENVGYQTFNKKIKTPPDRPFAFVVVPKTELEIVLEENTQSYIDEPPVWKEAARLKRK